MTLGRARSGFLRIGIRVWSRLCAVWSELLTVAMSCLMQDGVDGIRAFTRFVKCQCFRRPRGSPGRFVVLQLKCAIVPPQLPRLGSSTYPRKRESDCLVVSFAQTQAESCPIVSVRVTLMPYRFDWRHYVRYGCGGNNSCDSGGCVVRASRVKRFS